MRSLISSLFILTFVSIGLSQSPATASADEWIRVSSNDGEFSIEVPAKHAFFADTNGFSVGQNMSDYQLRNMYMLTTFYRGTLISFEAYEGGKGAFQALYDVDAYDNDGRKTSESKNGKVRIKEVTNTTKTHFAVRQFIKTSDHIYILTAANRTGESAEMRRFLDSLKINEGASSIEAGAVPFSRLKVDIPKIIFDDIDSRSSSLKKAPQAAKALDDPSVKRYVTVRAVRRSYVPEARDGRVKGTIRIKLKVEPDASISEVSVLTSLPGGLLKQAVFAAIRGKFIPKEKDGVPVLAYLTFEFGFGFS